MYDIILNIKKIYWISLIRIESSELSYLHEIKQ